MGPSVKNKASCMVTFTKTFYPRKDSIWAYSGDIIIRFIVGLIGMVSLEFGLVRQLLGHFKML